MKGLLLINLGTPDGPDRRSVRRFLKEFLSDPLVVDLPPFVRWTLLNLFVLPFRTPRTAARYRKIWENGPPLLLHTLHLKEEVSKILGKEYVVEVGMRYGNPSLASAVTRLVQANPSEIRILPLFPQRAASSFGTAVEAAQAAIARHLPVSLPITPPPLPSREHGSPSYLKRGMMEFSVSPSLNVREGGRGVSYSKEVTVIEPFFNHPGFIASWADVGRPILQRVRPDHVLFSFHGIPLRQAQKRDSAYAGQCHITAEAIAAALGIKGFSVCFQSRMGPISWLGPPTDRHLLDLIGEGKRKFLVFCPSYVTDCLETIEEIGIRLRHLALQKGAVSFDLVPSLNASPRWVETVCRLARQGAAEEKN